MANLESIDLTSGARFSKDGDNSIIISSFNNITHRLRKGEIPHVSKDNNIVYNSANNIYYTTIEYTIPDMAENTWHINYNNSVTSTLSTASFSIPSDSWDIDNSTIIDNQIVQYNNTWINITSNITNTYSKWSNFYTSDQDIVNKSLKTRIKYDPFDDPVTFSTTDIEERLKQHRYDRRYQKRNNDSDIGDRINSKTPKGHIDYRFHEVFGEINILDRMHQSDEKSNSRNGLITHKKYEELLDRAPMARRVYSTNLNRSFDSTEFKLDMEIAKERFESAMSRLSL